MLATGATIGPYRVLEPIGSGGMALVYKAEQPSLNRMVAIKELRAELVADSSLILRFEREALCIAGLTHHNIVHVYDYMTHGDSMLIVMEYVDGIDLASLMHQSGRIPPAVAAIIALEAARALEHAHHRGVVHRDFKPSNLMISRQGEVKLMDFGIARGETHSGLTRPGTALGTPSYMSPEQIMGRRVDARSDLFSFGVVLYQMLTGCRPFTEEDGQHTMQRILREAYRGPGTHYPDIPVALQRVVKRCLRKRPERRYQSTEELRRVLETHVARRVRLNHNTRLVIYLRHRDIISEGDARRCVNRAALEASGSRSADSGAVDVRAALWRPLLRINAGVLLLAACWAMLVAWTDLGFHPAYVQVHAQPWAAVYVDGSYHGTTPLKAAIPVEPGQHLVELRHTYYAPQVRQVELAAKETQSLRVTFGPPSAHPPTPPTDAFRDGPPHPQDAHASDSGTESADVPTAGPPPGADTQPGPAHSRALRKAVARRDDGALDEACSQLEALLDTKGLSDDDQIELAWQLGVCAVASDDRHAAVDYFRRVRVLAPELRPDPVTTSPKVREMFEAAGP